MVTRERSGDTVISSVPPGSRTSTGAPAGTSPRRTAATVAAQAPVPQASVRPAPRSQTTSSMPRGPGRAKPTFTPPATALSIRGPTSAARARDGSSKRIACGFPIDTRTAWRRSAPISNSCSPARLGEVAGEAADGVAAHLGDRAVGVVDVHRNGCARGSRGQDRHDAVGADPAVTIAYAARSLGVHERPLDEHEVVPEAVVLREAERHAAHHSAVRPNLARVRVRFGRQADARKVLEHLLARSPGFGAARHARVTRAPAGSSP